MHLEPRRARVRWASHGIVEIASDRDGLRSTAAGRLYGNMRTRQSGSVEAAITELAVSNPIEGDHGGDVMHANTPRMPFPTLDNDGRSWSVERHNGTFWHRAQSHLGLGR